MAQKSFQAQVSAWVAKSIDRTETVFRESAHDVVTEMNEVGPSVANPSSFGTGHMPVDKNFLRASLDVGLNQPANTMTEVPPNGVEHFDYSPEVFTLTINSAKLGDKIFATYGASYAKAMNIKYNFVDLAAANWQKIVSRRARIVKQRVTAALAAPRNG